MTFEEQAKRAIRDLMRDFQMDAISAAAIVGNFGHETAGFTKLQEIKPTVAGSRGGYGWAQWTGPRRRQYEAWCDRKSLDPSTYEANYGYVKYELQNDYSAAVTRVRAAGSLRDKVIAFEVAYEGAGVKAYDSRVRWAQRALTAFGMTPLPPDIVPVPKPPKKPPIKPAHVGIFGAMAAAWIAFGNYMHAHSSIIGAGVFVLLAAFAAFIIWRNRS